MRNDKNQEMRNETTKRIPNLNYYPGFKEMIIEMIRNDKKYNMIIWKNYYKHITSILQAYYKHMISSSSFENKVNTSSNDESCIIYIK